MTRLRSPTVLLVGLLTMPASALGVPSAFGPSRPIATVAARAVQADMNGRDSALVGWTRPGAGAGVEVAFRPAQGPFGRPVSVGPGRLEGIALAERGARGVVIRRIDNEVRATYVNRVRVIDDELIRVRLVSGVSARVLGVRITADGSGFLAVALGSRDEWRLQTFRRSGGRWERVGDDLVLPGRSQAQAAMDSAGGLSVAWVDDTATVGDATVEVARRPSGSDAWTTPVVLASVPFDEGRAFTTSIATNDQGDAAVGVTVLPVEPRGRARGVVAIRSVDAQVWALAADLPAVSGVAVSPSGEVIAAYRQAVVGTSGQETLLAASLDNVTRQWGTAEPLDQYAIVERGTVEGPRLAALGDGRLVASWTSDTPQARAFATVRDVAGDWAPVAEFGETTTQIAVGDTRGIAAWRDVGRSPVIRVSLVGPGAKPGL